MRVWVALVSLGMLLDWSAVALPPAGELKALMRKELDAWQTLDPANAAPFYAKNAGDVYFDIAPFKYAGWPAYADGVKQTFPDLASVKFTIGDDVQMHQQGRTAWAASSLHFDMVHKNGASESFDARWTLVWEKRGAKWLVVHEHVSAPMPVAAPPSATAAAPSLYKRLGGYDALAAVTDDFMARMVKDPQLGKYFVGHSADSMYRVRQLIVDKLCEAAGGPCVYIGRSMKAAHAGMGLSESDWDLAVDHLIESMNQFKVPDRERDDVLAAVASLKADVLSSGKAGQ